MESDILFSLMKSKGTAANLLVERLEDMLPNIDKVLTNTQVSLPKFDGEGEQNEFEEYLAKLEKAANDPVRQSLISKFKELGVSKSEFIPNDKLDDENISTSVKLLEAIKKKEIFNQIVSEKFYDILVGSDTSSTNKLLEVLLTQSDQSKKVIDDILDPNLRAHFIENSYDDIERDGQIAKRTNSEIERVTLIQHMISKPVEVSDLTKLEETEGMITKLKRVNFDFTSFGIKKDTHDLSLSLKKTIDEFQKLSSEYRVFERLLNNTNGEQSLDFPLLRKMLPEMKKSLRNKVGKNFEEIVKFVVSGEGSLKPDPLELRKFLILIRPLIKEVLTGD